MPLTERAAKAIGDQQTYVAAQVAGGSPWLFPDTHHPDGADRPISYRFLHRRLCNWETHIDLRDEAGLPITVSPHQFRHTRDKADQHRRPSAHRATHPYTCQSRDDRCVRPAHDSTIRIAFDRFQQQRVDIAGRLLSYDPESPAADAEWLKHNLARSPSQPSQRLLRTTASAGMSPSQRLRNAKLVFRTRCVIDAEGAGLYRRPGPARGHGGRPRKARPSV